MGDELAARWQTVEEFVAVEELGAAALLGTEGEALIPENGDVLAYGDGGAGKTTLSIDLAFHLAAGDDWLGFPVRRPLHVAIIENEGPRPQFRGKLRRKHEAWTGSPLDSRLIVLEEPWATVTFADEHWQNDLAATIDERKLDLVVVGPVTCSGMDEAGTLQEVRDFVRLLKDVRARAHRPVAFLLVHHESKAGRVSGAWEGATDTLLHVASEGQARTRLYVQKARWASSYHALTLQLGWTDGDGFEIIDRPEVSDETIRASLLVAVRALPGASWSKIRDYRVDGEKIVRGNLQQVATVRDRLLAERALVNSAAQEGRFNLWLADDPAAPGSGAGTGPERPPFASTGEGDGPTRSPFPPYKGTGNGTERPSPVHLGDEWYQVALAEAGNAGHLTEREFDELLSLHRFVEEAAP